MQTVDNIPGYKEAVARENLYRLECWLGLEEPICGVQMAPLTLRKVIYLTAARNPFVDSSAGGTQWQPYHVAEFLWVCSAEFVQGPGKHAERCRKRFFRRNKRIRVMDAMDGISKYIHQSYYDMIRGGGAAGLAPKSGWVAGMVSSVAEAFGWSVDEILNLPIKQFIQLQRGQMVGDPDTRKLLNNPESDLVLASYLEGMNARKN